MADPIRLILNGEPVEIRDEPPTRTLLDWLRETRRLTGTKEGCAEGDCGACTVGIRSLGPEGALETRPANACILLLPMLHGLEVVTVEHLRAPDGSPHPVQKAMADGHAAQCGFCTPGIVMSLWAGCAQARPTDPASVKELLQGNLCRCTGYGPILDAAAAAAEAPRGAWSEADAAAAVDRLAAIGADAALVYEAHGATAFAPTDLDALCALAQAHPDATILSGATDIGLWVTKRGFAAETWILTGRVAELQAIVADAATTAIGAGVSWEAARDALSADHPALEELIARVGGAQIRAAGTIGGNIANGSPIGDLPPALIALEATLILRRGASEIAMPLEDYFVAYGRQNRAPGDVVVRVEIPRRAAAPLAAYKISKRFDEDITAVLGCFVIAVEDGRVTRARLAFGGMAGTPARARAAEAALLDAPWTEATIETAVVALETDFQPISDHRAGAAYRRRVAGNLLRKHFFERTEPDVATRLKGCDAVPLSAQEAAE